MSRPSVGEVARTAAILCAVVAFFCTLVVLASDFYQYGLDLPATRWAYFVLMFAIQAFVLLASW